MANMQVKDGAAATKYLGSLGVGSDADPFMLLRADFKSAVAAGLVPGWGVMNAMGEREGMGTTATGEDIWRGNDLSPAPTSHTSIPMPADAGEQMTIVSEDAADNSTGTGVRTLRIDYIDAAGAEQYEVVTLNGTTGVNTTATNIRFVNDMYTQTAGSNGAAEGHIKIYKTGTVGLVYNMVAGGGNKSLIPNRMVPAGKTLIVKGWNCAEAQGKRVAFRIRSTDMNNTLIPGVFCFKGIQYLNKSTSGDIEMNIPVPALSIVKVSGWGDAAGGEASCDWVGFLVDD